MMANQRQERLEISKPAGLSTESWPKQPRPLKLNSRSPSEADTADVQLAQWRQNSELEAAAGCGGVGRADGSVRLDYASPVVVHPVCRPVRRAHDLKMGKCDFRADNIRFMMLEERADHDKI